LAEHPELYADAVEAIDLNLSKEATEAEFNRKGAGLTCIIKALAMKGLQL
jgi:hypothetical protein